jgi:hypothetical protein
VFGFLPLIALGRLDAAVANKTRRPELLEAVSFVTTVIPPFLSVEQTVQFEKEIWHWCVRRKVSLTNVRFSNVEDGEELFLLEKLLVRVVFSGVVHYECDLGSDSEGSISCVLPVSHGYEQDLQSHLANDRGRRCFDMEVGRYAQHKGANRDRKRCP